MIELQNVTKKFGNHTAIQNVSLTVHQGEIHGLIGASGAGKSTMLRVMNLLEIPDSGSVYVGERELTTRSKRELREARKRIGMIFQHFNLVLNKTVEQNVAVSLQLAQVPKHQRIDRVRECLRFVGLEDQMDKYPAQLSGGQKQRVAIARALANEPEVLLCDEPTSSLDPHTTSEILTVIRDIHERLGVTVIIVSHEMNVIKSICQRVTVMDQGTIYETVQIESSGIPRSDRSPERFIKELKNDA
ncbi:methionine ABC transporter ATP-binding protein [Geomicrobium sp. JCM 19038]|uniref:methionine ABC transporter ATP-binding protein n=1 Tax=Geomicrobium sp. JCM 19038 TaxID=1460635 RepID=UPI0006931EBD|nr:ATP-binding cassette domain-containing protein [Geomicrobium sp. JCM 19038]